MKRASLLTMVFALATVAPAFAGTIGPTYPPPGGVTFFGSGAGAGEIGGRTFNYTGLNPAAYSELFLGLEWAFGPLNNSGGLQSATAVSLSGGVATFTFANPFFIDRDCGGCDLSVPVRYTATASTGSWTTASGPYTGTSPFLNVWLPVTTTAFSVTHLFEVNIGTTAAPVWRALFDYYDPISFKPAGASVKTDFKTGFWYSVPEPDSLAPLMLGLLSLAAVAISSRSRLF